MSSESCHPVFELAPEGIGHVTEAHRPVHEPLERCTGDVRRHIYNDSLESGSVIVALHSDLEIAEGPVVLPGHMGDGERET